MTLLLALCANLTAWAQYVFVYAQPNSAATVKVGTSLVLDEFVDGAGFTMAEPGQTVYFGYSTQDYKLTGIRCDDLASSDITTMNDNIYSFVMPDGVQFLTIWMDFEYDGEPVVVTGVEINEENVPDEKFRDWLKSQNYGKDGVITDTEMSGITKIVARSCGITDLTGIEHFTALQELYVDNKLDSPEESKNQITSLDLSANTFLRKLYCNNNKISSLNLTNNSRLENIDCTDNLLTQLDVTACTNLSMLSCGNNLLKTLDVTQNRKLELLQCSENQLQKLNLSNNPLLDQLYCDNNQLTEIDFTNQTVLQILNCNNNQLTSLEVNSDKLFQLYCYNNKIKSQAMTTLVNSLPECPAYMVVLDRDSGIEQNEITEEQAAVANAKGWSVEALENEDFVPVFVSDTHEYVDLGLSSGTLWATCNVGAYRPQDAGLFFAWGDTDGHGSDTTDGYLFNWTNYKWGEVSGEDTYFTKYCSDSSRGKDGFTDGKYELDPEDDAAYVNWGSMWRTPTKQQMEELRTECEWTPTTIGDVKGYEVTSNINGNSIFLPEAGWRIDDMYLEGGSYWSRSTSPEDVGGAYQLAWDDWGWYEFGGRCNGQTVRPVVCQVLELADNGSNSTGIEEAASTGMTFDVKLLDRKLYKDGEWNTLCLPFSLTEEQLSESPLAGADIRTMASATVTGHHVDLTFGDNVSSLTAGTPYIVKWDADTENPTISEPVFSGVTISDETNNFTSTDGHVNFIGYYDAFAITPSDDPLIYYLTTGNMLKFTGTERTLKACRAYFTFTASDGSSANDFTFDIDFGNKNTDIRNPQLTIDNQNDDWYTIDGRRLKGTPSAKGVYINNGKKVTIK